MEGYLYLSSLCYGEALANQEMIHNINLKEIHHILNNR